MKKLFCFLLLFFFVSCSYEALPEDKENNIEQTEKGNRFSGIDFNYLTFDGANPKIDLKSQKINYHSYQSEFHLTHLSTQIQMGEHKTHLKAENGVHYLETGNFDFSGMVKIVLEDRYLLEGTFFSWDEGQKQLKSKEGFRVRIQDEEGLKIEGENFFLESGSNSFSLNNTFITIPDKMADDEGLN